MAHSLRVTGWFLLTLLLAGCGIVPSTKTPAQRLTYVLTTQQQAEAAYHSGDMEHAAAFYLQLTKMLPQEADYWYMLGNSYVRTQRPDQAVQAYQQAIVRNPNHARAWHNLGIVRMRQAMAAFVSSASTAPAEDPMHDLSTHLVAELGRISSSNVNVRSQDLLTTPPPVRAVRRRPGASPTSTDQP
jgi:Tfp pilus assembly protein PilF